MAKTKRNTVSAAPLVFTLLAIFSLITILTQGSRILRLFNPRQHKTLAAACDIPLTGKILENNYIRIHPSPCMPGILDLSYKTSAGQWKLFNNVVPIAKVGGSWNNAELEQSAITATAVPTGITGRNQMIYNFTAFGNGADIQLIVTLEDRKKISGRTRTLADRELKIEVIQEGVTPNAFSLGNYYGLSDFVGTVKPEGGVLIPAGAATGGTVLYARDFGGNPVLDPSGNPLFGQPGKFMFFDTYNNNNFTGKKVRFWGDASPIRHYQRYLIAPALRDEFVLEVRQIPWLQSQLPLHPDNGRNVPYPLWASWFETVHLTRNAPLVSPTEPNRMVWIFGWEKK